MRKVDEYLAQKKEEGPDYNAEKWRHIEDLYQKKLWYPLTNNVLECLNDAKFTEKLDFMAFYSNFVADFEHRINFVSLVQILSIIARTVADPIQACHFLERARETVKQHDEATVLCLTALAEQKLRCRDGSGKCTEIKKVKELIDEANVKLDALPGITAVHASFYKISSVYLQEVADFAGYYLEALRYVGCVDLNTLSKEEKHRQAVCLSLAALVGEGVYNFGELIAHPILNSLKGTSDEWFVEMLRVFNAGNLSKFEELMKKHSQVDLQNNTEKLKTKIRLLCLLEMAFVRKANERQLSFKEIAAKTQLPLNDVERLVMKALANELIKGRIDQVAQVVNVTWVQPRVLSRQQIGDMASRIEQWIADVSNNKAVAESHAEEILV